MQQTDNYNMNKPELNDFADIRKIAENFDTTDRGIIYDVGASTGEGNNYILDIGNINLGAGKKPSLRFWADKDSTGAVTINGTYSLIKAGGGKVTNIKKYAPYVVTFDGTSNFFLASGGGLDAVTFTSDKLLENYTANDSDGNAVVGTMPERGNVTQVQSLNGTINLPEGHYNSIKVTQNVTTRGGQTNAVSVGKNDDNLYARIPQGAYFTNADGQSYPEIVVSWDLIGNAISGLPESTKSTVFNKLGASECVKGNFTKELYSDTAEVTLEFKPDLVVIGVANNSFKNLWTYMSSNSPWGAEDNRGWVNYNDSSNTDYVGYITVTDTGFTFSKSFNSNTQLNYIAVKF